MMYRLILITDLQSITLALILLQRPGREFNPTLRQLYQSYG